VAYFYKTFYSKLHTSICFALALKAKYYYSDQIKAAEMGTASSMYGRDEEYIQGFSGKA
jgi:hypothetical protein